MLSKNLFMLISVTSSAWQCNRLDRLRSLTQGRKKTEQQVLESHPSRISGKNLMTSLELQQKTGEERDKYVEGVGNSSDKVKKPGNVMRHKSVAMMKSNFNYLIMEIY